MGEKETGAATEEGERRQHGPGPIQGTTSSLRESPSRASGGSTSFRESPSRASSGRSIPENSPDPGDVDDDGTPEGPVSIQKNKTKSNQSNDRLGHEDDPDGSSGLDDDGDGMPEAAVESHGIVVKRPDGGSG